LVQNFFLVRFKTIENGTALERYTNYKKPSFSLYFPFTLHWKLTDNSTISARPKAAIIREKGSNSEREMANAMYLAGFDVKDVHMTDLIAGRETLEDIQFIGAVRWFLKL